MTSETLRALLTLHQEGTQTDWSEPAYPRRFSVCMECRDEKGWPCPTRAILDAATEERAP